MAQQEMDRLLEHDADGIQEFDNSLPKWWLYGFYVTIVLSVIYMFYYHVYGGPDWNFLWYTQRGMVSEYNAEVDAAKAMYKSTAFDASTASPLTDQAILDKGKAIFEGTTNACFTCHRNDMGGQVGPNLTDEFWLHGGAYKDIINSVITGYPEKGMLPYGTAAKLNNDELIAVTSYIWSKRGSNPPEPKPIDAERDKKFDMNGNPVQ